MRIHWTVSRKLGTLFLALALAVGWGGGAGLRGISLLRQQIVHFMGPVWNEVYGAAELSRAMASQLNAVQQLRGASNSQEASEAQEALEAAKVALGAAERLVGEANPSLRDQLRQGLDDFRATRLDLLERTQTFHERHRALLMAFDDFQEFIRTLRRFEMAQQELREAARLDESDETDLGFGLGEELAGALAASSGTDVHILLLEWFYHYQQLVSAGDRVQDSQVVETVARLEGALGKLRATTADLATLPTFQSPPDDRSLGEGTYAEILADFLARHEQGYSRAFKALRARREAADSYRRIASRVLTTLGSARARADRSLADQRDEVLAAAESARRGILFAITGLVLLALAAWFYTSIYLSRPLREVSAAMSRFARGDTEVHVPEVRTKDEVGSLVVSLRSLLAGVRQREERLRGSAMLLGEEARNVAGASSHQSQLITTQASAIRETATAATELRSMTLKAKEVAETVHAQASRSVDASREGVEANQSAKDRVGLLGQRVNEISDAVNSLSKKMEHIREILAAVNELAEQSKLLALNAAIEAARAGEHGRGFGVVSLEVRNLAQQSQDATRQIRTIIREIEDTMAPARQAAEEGQVDAQGGREAIDRTQEVIDRLARTIAESQRAAEQILKSVNQQDIGIEQISNAIDNIDAALSESVETAERTRAVSERLLEAEDDLTRLMGEMHDADPSE